MLIAVQLIQANSQTISETISQMQKQTNVLQSDVQRASIAKITPNIGGVKAYDEEVREVVGLTNSPAECDAQLLCLVARRSTRYISLA